MLIKQFIIASILLASSLSFAGTISEISIGSETASAVDASNPANVIVYGGFAGDVSGCSGDAVCSTCAVAPLISAGALVCNNRSIHFGVNLYVSFRASEIPTGASILVMHDQSTIAVTDKTADSDLSANSQVYFRIPWTVLCDKGGATNCVGSFATDLRFGISTANNGSGFSSEGKIAIKFRYVDQATAVYHSTPTTDPQTGEKVCQLANEGFCDFKVFPGDGKAYAQDLIRAAIGPGDASGIKWNAVRFYYAPNSGFNNLSPKDSYRDLVVSNKDAIDSDVRPGYIDGLTNDQDYMFAMATVDEAGNASYFSNPGTLQVARHTALPGEVVGLLDDKKCFIATAAFGSSQDPYVSILRKFRDHYLKTNAIGASFVDFYYEHSPVIANFIAKHDTLRAVVRVMLWPLIGFANASLSFGFGTALALLLGAVMTVILVAKRKRERA